MEFCYTRERGQKSQMKTNPFVCRAGFLSPSGDGFCPQQNQNSARHSWGWKEEMGFDDSGKEKPGQVDDVPMQRGMTRGEVIQVAMEEFFTRKAVGESLLAYLDKEMMGCGRETHRSAINFWASHIRNVKDR